MLRGSPVYCVTDVALTPLTSYSAALTSIATTRSKLAKGPEKRPAKPGAEDDVPRPSMETTDDEGVYSALGSDDVDDEEIVPIEPALDDKAPKRRSTVVADVFAKKGGYGRFAKNWFGKSTSGGVGLAAAAAAVEDDVPEVPEVAAPVSELDGKNSVKEVVDEDDKDGHVKALLPKLLRTTSLLFGSSRSFFFSYDYDITRAQGTQGQNGAENLPLHQVVDPLFFWNRHVMQPFIDAGQYSLVLPLMQGFVGQKSFMVERHPVVLPDGVPLGDKVVEMKDFAPKTSAEEEEAKVGMAHLQRADTPKYDGHEYECDDETCANNFPTVDGCHHSKQHSETVDNVATYLLTIISRRSVKRAGLRYLRRGVDDDGHCANAVETEQILSTSEFSGKVYSFLQIRGSIPVFFSQSPYSFKPVPQMMNSEARNYDAFTKHFENLRVRYGVVIADSLVEKHDNEAIVGNSYQNFIEKLNAEAESDDGKVGFEWFDFHAACRGMKFENVSLLVDTLAPRLDEFGYTAVLYTADGKAHIEKKQKGVLRTNCMDCLDRTNVTQSAVAWRTLCLQLLEDGIDFSSQNPEYGDSSFFNILWADNGDAVSRQYASTAALKGDFTRTKKRDYRGVIADAGLSISRFYSGIVNDYFSQTSIDFLLGNVTARVFDDFATNLMSADPSISLSRTRQMGIDVAYKLAVADQDEELIGGWAFLTPTAGNTRRAQGGEMEEAVLLLTERALYLCRLDWGMEKVRGFERVDLRHVRSIKWGPYITSTLTAAQKDEGKNVGLVIGFAKGKQDIVRVNTRSLSTVPSRKGLEPTTVGSDSDAATMVPRRSPKKPSDEVGSKKEASSTPEESIIALKCLPSQSSAAIDEKDQGLSEQEMARTVAEDIGRLVEEVRGDSWHGKGGEKKDERVVQEGDIIGIKEASKATGWVEVLGWKMKKLVWA